MPKQLCHKDGTPCKAGDSLTDFRGDHATYVSSELPKHLASTGRVYVRFDPSQEHPNAFYPSVFNLEWRD